MTLPAIALAEVDCICRCPGRDHGTDGFRACHCCRCFAFRPTVEIDRWYARRAALGDYKTPYNWDPEPSGTPGRGKQCAVCKAPDPEHAWRFELAPRLVVGLCVCAKHVHLPYPDSRAKLREWSAAGWKFGLPAPDGSITIPLPETGIATVDGREVPAE